MSGSAWLQRQGGATPAVAQADALGIGGGNWNNGIYGRVISAEGAQLGGTAPVLLRVLTAILLITMPLILIKLLTGWLIVLIQRRGRGSISG